MNGIPAVKAYRHGLPPSQRGIEFTTDVQPSKGSGTPIEARWYLPIPGNPSNGVQLRTKNGVDYACIPAEVDNRQP